MFDLDKFTFADVSIKSDDAGTPQSSSKHQEYDCVLPQLIVNSTIRGSGATSSCENSAISGLTVVDPQTSTSSQNQTTVDKSPSFGNENHQHGTSIPPIPPPPCPSEADTSNSPAEVSLDDTHLQPSPQNAFVPYQGDLIYLKSHPADQVIGNIRSGVLTRSQSQNICLFAGFLSLI